MKNVPKISQRKNKNLFKKTLGIKFIFTKIKAINKFINPLEKFILLSDNPTPARDSKLNIVVAIIKQKQTDHHKVLLLQIIKHHPFFKNFKKCNKNFSIRNYFILPKMLAKKYLFVKLAFRSHHKSTSIFIVAMLLKN